MICKGYWGRASEGDVEPLVEPIPEQIPGSRF